MRPASTQGAEGGSEIDRLTGTGEELSALAPFVVRARPLGLLAASMLIGLLSLAAPFAFAMLGYGVDPGNARMVWLVTLIVIVLLLAYALFERSKTLRVEHGRLEASSWLGSRSVDLADLGSVSIRWWATGEGTMQLPSLVFWDHQDRTVADVGVYFFKRRDLSRLVSRLRSERPDLQVDGEVRRYVGDA